MRCRGPVKSVALCFMKRGKKRTLKVSIFHQTRESVDMSTHIYTLALFH